MTGPRHRLPKRTESSADETTDETPTEETATAEPPTEETATDETASDGTATDERAEADVPAEADVAESTEPDSAKNRRVNWSRVLAFGVLPGLAMVLALAAGYVKWQDNSVRAAEAAVEQSVQAAKDSTSALLSYQPDTVEQQLTAARDLIIGGFRDSYTQLTNDVVIPGAKQQQITAVAQVPAAASVSASSNQAVVLVFVNQTVTVGTGAPTNTASSVKVTLEKVDGRWLISAFEPV